MLTATPLTTISELIQAVSLSPAEQWFLVTVAGVLVTAIGVVSWWFIRFLVARMSHLMGELNIHAIKDEKAFAEVNASITEVKDEVVNKVNNMLQPLHSKLDILKEDFDRSASLGEDRRKTAEQLVNRVEKLTIAVARSNPNIRLEDIR